MSSATKNIPPASVDIRTTFATRIRAVPVNKPLPCKLYLEVAEKLTLFRTEGDLLSPERIEKLKNYNAKVIHIPLEQKQIFRSFLWGQIQDEKLSDKDRLNLIKEAGLMQVEELFTTHNIKAVIDATMEMLKKTSHLVVADVESLTNVKSENIHDVYAYNHGVNVALFSMTLTKKLYGIDSELTRQVGLTAFLHDIGERKVNQKILEKRDALSKEEWIEVKKHTLHALEAVKHIENLSDETLRALRSHHENYDGSGYPDGLVGEEISGLARILATCDVFDALTGNRPYQPALQPKEALGVMKALQPGRFDPEYLKLFEECLL